MTLSSALMATGILLQITPAAEAEAAPVAIPIELEMLAIIAASVGGALTARERKLDLLGSIMLAGACALGGGLLRDMIMQVGDVYIIKQPLAIPISIATAGIVFTFPHVIGRQDRIIALLDIFAVGLFAATGADKAYIYGYEPLLCIIMGFFTAVGGGMMRDVFLGQTPAIFQRSAFYAVASIGGAAVYTAIVMEKFASNITAFVLCVAVTMGLRYLSVRFNIMSPTEIDLNQMATPIKKIAAAPKKTRRRKLH